MYTPFTKQAEADVAQAIERQSHESVIDLTGNLPFEREVLALAQQDIEQVLANQPLTDEAVDAEIDKMLGGIADDIDEDDEDDDEDVCAYCGDPDCFEECEEDEDEDDICDCGDPFCGEDEDEDDDPEDEELEYDYDELDGEDDYGLGYGEGFSAGLATGKAEAEQAALLADLERRANEVQAKIDAAGYVDARRSEGEPSLFRRALAQLREWWSIA